MAVDYSLLERQLVALAAADSDPLALSANFVALLYAELPAINWLGIYVTRGSDLVLGPFQGMPACVRIPFGQGVCGTAAEDAVTMRVADVHAFDGHIACDPASNSELVVPLMTDSNVIGVLDIDSPQQNRFTEKDQMGVERLCQVFVGQLQFGQETIRGFI